MAITINKMSNRTKIYKRKYPLGCHRCKDRDTCRLVKLNEVSRCEINRENMIKYGYKRRLSL